MSDAMPNQKIEDSPKRSIASKYEGKLIPAKVILETPSPNIWTEATIKLLRSK